MALGICGTPSCPPPCIPVRRIRGTPGRYDVFAALLAVTTDFGHPWPLRRIWDTPGRYDSFEPDNDDNDDDGNDNGFSCGSFVRNRGGLGAVCFLKAVLKLSS